MPTCKKCGGHFPWKVKINGVRKYLGKRRYCLTCSPFGLHNTRQLEKAKKRNTAKTCPKCGKTHSYKGIVCSSCRTTIRRKVLQDKVHDIVGEKCQICGYNKCRRGLNFHHIDPSIKEFGLSLTGISQFAWNKVLTELNKCILVCSNCHAEIHDKKIDQETVEEIHSRNPRVD